MPRSRRAAISDCRDIDVAWRQRHHKNRADRPEEPKFSDDVVRFISSRTAVTKHARDFHGFLTWRLSLPDDGDNTSMREAVNNVVDFASHFSPMLAS